MSVIPFSASMQQRIADTPPLARPLRSIVVFRALRLGDMLCAVPALRALRDAQPAAAIGLVTLPSAAQWMRRYDRYVDDIAVFPGDARLPERTVDDAARADFDATLARWQPDLAIQMHGDGRVTNAIVGRFGARAVAGFTRTDAVPTTRAWLPYPDRGPEPLRLLQLVRALGASTPSADASHLEFPLTPADHAELRDSGLLARLGDRPLLCVHPGASAAHKCWPPDAFAHVARHLAACHGLTIVLTGSAAEQPLARHVAARTGGDTIDATCGLSIGAMAALIARARLLLCNDTGVSHLAAALRVPSVVVFGRADPERWAPLDRNRHVCVRDPDAARVNDVLEAGCMLLSRDARAHAAAALSPPRDDVSAR
ncbi:glycosyltransferase family 9 protein [Burkholderia multivorans]|uniref:glycosyltransferase family 9 protein n=1 Tax=Burkholderia multivorans TaxID=87883 RepID=UPI0021C1384D|nr:glycosyltransferase family 9 protein [Burkholderia multivorans]